jgi:integrase
MTDRRHFGTVRKRHSGKWQAVYWHEGRFRSAGTFSAKADALAQLSVIESDLRRGAWIDPRAGKVTLEVYATEWLGLRPDLSIRTRELYEYLLGKHILPTLGRIELQKLAPSKIRGWHAELASRHASTAAKAYRLLSTITRTAVTDGLIVISPCKVKNGGIEHAEERPVATVAEVDALADAMPERLRLIVLLATWCQLRRGEILGLRRCDIDLLHGVLRIEQSRTFSRDGSSIIKAPKSAAGKRTLSIPRHVIQEIDDHLRKFALGGTNDLIFTNEARSELSAATLQRAWNNARQVVGRPDLHLHDLRHTGLTLAAATGATTTELMRRAGHASSDAALRCQHATQDRDRVLAVALEELARPAGVESLHTSTRNQ